MEGASGGRGCSRRCEELGFGFLSCAQTRQLYGQEAKGRGQRGRGEAHMFSRGVFLQVVIHRDQFTDLNAARLPFFP